MEIDNTNRQNTTLIYIREDYTALTVVTAISMTLLGLFVVLAIVGAIFFAKWRKQLCSLLQRCMSSDSKEWKRRRRTESGDASVPSTVSEEHNDETTPLNPTFALQYLPQRERNDSELAEHGIISRHVHSSNLQQRSRSHLHTQVVHHTHISHYGHVHVAGGTNVSIGGVVTNTTRQIEEQRQPTTLCESIAAKTASQVEAHTKGMVRPKIVDDIVTKINRGQTLVTIMGKPGEGKSIAAYLTMKELQEKGRQIFHVSSPEEFTEITSIYTWPIILLNKIFGDSLYKPEEYERWKDILNKYLDASLQEPFGGYAGTQNKEATILLVEHDDFLTSACRHLGKLSDFISHSSHVVRIKFDMGEKMKILMSILATGNILLSDRTMRRVCEKHDGTNFTGTCRLFVTLLKDDPNIPVDAFFNTPLNFLNKALQKVLLSSCNEKLLKELIKEGGKLSEEAIKEMNNGIQILQAAQSLVGLYLRNEGKYFMFHNLSISDSVEYIICKQFTEFVIEACPLSLISVRFSLRSSDDAEGSLTEDKKVVLLSNRQGTVLAKRFASEIKKKNLMFVLSHSACTLNWFIQEMMQHLDISQVLDFSDQKTNHSFLYLVPSNRCPQLLMYIDNKTDVLQTDNRISSVLFGVCKFAATKVFKYLKKQCKNLDVNISEVSDKMLTPLMIVAQTKDKELVLEILSLKPDLNVRDRDGATALHYLCLNGLVSEAKEALDIGADINATDRNGLTPIHYAGKNNEVETVELLLERKATIDVKLVRVLCEEAITDVVKLLFESSVNVNMSLGFGDTPLLAACRGGSVDVIDFLFQKGASIIPASELDKSPLHMACYHNRPDAVCCLLKHKCEMNTTNLAGETPLHIAAEGGAKECVELLVKLNENVNSQSKTGDTPLHKASARGSIRCLYPLLNDKRTNVNMQNREGDTPLHMAVIARSKVCLCALLEAGVNIDEQNIDFDTPLHKAASNGAKDCVSELLRVGADVTVKNKTGITPLHRAAEGGFNKCVSLLVKSEADINAKDNNGKTPLHKAVEKGFKDCVNMLLQVAADPMLTDDFGKSPLHTAVETCSSECTALLLNAGADANLKTKIGFTPIHIAAEKGSLECIHLLLKAGAEVNVTCDVDSTPLHKAAKNGFKECLEILLNAKAEVDVKNTYGQTPLYKASEHGSKECAWYLIKNGAGVNEKTNNYNTPLHKATKSKSLSCVDLLLKEGADVNAMNRFKYVPLHMASEAGSIECVEMLLKRMKDVDPLSKYDETPLHKAAEKGSETCVDLLLHNKASVNAQTLTGNTPLHNAAEQGSSECIKRLLQEKPDLNEQNDEGYTPLLKAVFSQSETCVNLLLAVKACVHIQNHAGLTVLHVAAISGSISILKRLLETKANVSKQDRRGNTPLHKAAENGFIDCLDQLMAKGAELNVQNKLGLTPLHKAIVSRSSDCTKRLSDAGTNVNIKTFAGKTALEMIEET